MFYRVLLSIVASSASTGCQQDDTRLTTDEIEAVLNQLGPLDADAIADPSNAVAEDLAAAELGRELFFDSRYSSNESVSCATCHDPESGFQDARANTSLGISYTERHAPTVLNSCRIVDSAGANWMFWDGRTDSQWAQALGPPENEVEMGGTRCGVAYLIYDEYRVEYEAVFGAMPVLRDADGVALYPENAKPGDAEYDTLSVADQELLTQVFVNFGKAIAGYERRLVSPNAPFDTFYEEEILGGGTSEAISTSAVMGLALFVGKANCIACHNGPAFSDGEFHNLGLSQVGDQLPSQDEGREAGIQGVLTDEFNCTSQWSDQSDSSACAITALGADPTGLGAFKTPSLRQLGETAPYMHTGTLTSLREVVEFYNEGGHEDGFSGAKDTEIIPLGLSEIEIDQLVAFLNTLDGEVPDAQWLAPG